MIVRGSSYHWLLEGDEEFKHMYVDASLLLISSHGVLYWSDLCSAVERFQSHAYFATQFTMESKTAMKSMHNIIYNIQQKAKSFLVAK